MERKSFNFELKEADSKDNLGTIAGFASTFGNIDRDGDIITEKAFDDTIQSFKKSNKIIPMLSSHSYESLIGAFNPNDISISSKGLGVVGKIDLNIQRGREDYSLIKNGFLNSFSVGFSARTADMEFNKQGVRLIHKVNLYEISLAPVPANTEAIITEVKGVVGFKDYSIGADNSWDKDKAVDQIRAKTGSKDAPSSTYKNGFMWFDSSNADSFGAYKLPYVYDEDGFKANPHALSAIAGVMNGARGGVNIPDADRASIKAQVSKYFKKMGKNDPFSSTGSADKGLSAHVLKLSDAIDDFSLNLKMDLLSARLSK